MLAELTPAGAVETMLAQRAVGLSWRLRRVERLQNAAFAALDDGEPTPLLEARHEEWKQLKGSEWERGLIGLFDEDTAVGKVVVEDFGGARVLDRLLMYERRIESSLYRTMGELHQERQARTTAAGPEEVSRSQGGLAVGQESEPPAELASFGANSMAEGKAEEVPSAESHVSGNGSDFTLHTWEDNALRRHYEHAGRGESRAGRPCYEDASRSILRNEPNCGRSLTGGGVSRSERGVAGVRQSPAPVAGTDANPGIVRGFKGHSSVRSRVKRQVALRLPVRGVVYVYLEWPALLPGGGHMGNATS